MAGKVLNKIYEIKAECLTPFVIQNGKEIMPWEYVIFKEGAKNILYRFDLFRFYETLSEKEDNNNKSDKKEFKEKLNTEDILMLRSFVNKKINEKYEDRIKEIAVYSEEIDAKFYKIYSNNIYKDKRDGEINQLTIKEFIRSKGRPFIPGSSIKGAIRTAILYKHPQKDDIENAKPEESPFKYLSVRDSKFINTGMRVGYFSRSAPGYGEYLQKGTKLEFNIKVKDSPCEYRKQGVDFSEENIIKSANAFIKDKIVKYIADSKKLLQHPDMFKEGQEEKREKTRNLIEYYKNLLEEINKLKDNEFILNLGFGGSFWYKSFFENHPETGNKVETFVDDNISISRSLWMINGLPLGFIKCQIINEKNE